MMNLINNRNAWSRDIFNNIICEMIMRAKTEFILRTQRRWYGN